MPHAKKVSALFAAFAASISLTHGCLIPGTGSPSPSSTTSGMRSLSYQITFNEGDPDHVLKLADELNKVHPSLFPMESGSFTLATSSIKPSSEIQIVPLPESGFDWPPPIPLPEKIEFTVNKESFSKKATESILVYSFNELGTAGVFKWTTTKGSYYGVIGGGFGGIGPDKKVKLSVSVDIQSKPESFTLCLRGCGEPMPTQAPTPTPVPKKVATLPEDE